MNKVYVIGLPGAGKTYSGKKLAEALGWEFKDLDHMLEDIMQKPITSLFDEHGDEIFRQLEADVLRSTAKLKNTVISCGGGTPVWKDNMDWMQRHGLTVYLNPKIEKILPRIVRNKNKRPLFSGLSEGEIELKLKNFDENRGEFYAKARLIWNNDTPNAKLYSTVNQLLTLYSAPF